MSAPVISLAGRAVIVTGAGRGIGRAHAHLLAERGASVIVNDVGTDRDGDHPDVSVAARVVDEITALGGIAAADTNDISTPEGGEAVVRRALDVFGRLDVVVNNAGIYHAAPFMETSFADFERVWRIHVGGHINVTKAAWPVMAAAGGGRIIMTGSGSGLFGVSEQAAYGAAKGAIHSLTRALSLEGKASGIVVNAICPGGFSRMHETTTSEPEYLEMLEWTRRAMGPELAAPAVVWLASDACTVTGQIFTAWAGRVVRVAVGNGPGYFDRKLTPESITAHYADIAVLTPFEEPVSAVAEITAWRARHPAS